MVIVVVVEGVDGGGNGVVVVVNLSLRGGSGVVFVVGSGFFPGL